MTTRTDSLVQAGLASRAVQITFAGLLGLFIIVGTGFTSLPALHNAAHDYRHSTGFPCH
ncbi:CbtB-domain containing protein [Xanthobacter dioxanivorans]|uniref:CbtB-domain containing protein n=1 Tax=Xanthobacter dioxanivorans TaxID=2528964 RepID=A0A974PLB4_9HYPH|nr:CbtB domain-containing protein [Xanthobacter dioxanivorans]QRG05448.1 CbtB-domain containing protein [Xanthobacter dioxanivorans]